MDYPADNLAKYIRKGVPEKPGVYLFRDSRENVIYVGKSVNLKRRVLSYFHNNKSQERKKLKPLVSNICRVEFHETLNEFLALLLEDKLIKEFFPFYNVRQKKFRKYKYLMFTKGLFPTVKTVNSLKRIRNNIVFGPFQGEYYIRMLTNIILRYFNLRLCKESNPTTKCLYHDLEYCRAPCILNIMPLEYTNIVNRVQEFLNGDISYINPLLERKLRQHIKKEEFEDAQEIQKQIEFINNYSEKQAFLTRFKYGTMELYEDGGKVPKYIFNKGRLKINKEISYNEIIESNNKLFSIDNELFNDSRILLDRANIVYNWVYGGKNSYRYVFVS